MAWQGLRGVLKTCLYVFLLLAALLVASVLVQAVPALQRAEAWMQFHEEALAIATAATCALGVGVLLGTLLSRLMASASPVGLSGAGGSRDRGSIAISMADLKRPCRNRAAAWALAAGLLLVVVGGFGWAIVLVPMELKLLLGLAVAYALIRMAWAIAKA